VIGHQPLELLAGILAATVGVVQQRLGSSLRQIAMMSASVKTAPSSFASSTADHPPGEQIDDGRHIEPAFRRPDVGEVGNPFAVGSGRLKGPVEHIGSDGRRRPFTWIGRQATPSRSRPQAWSRISRSIRCSPQDIPSSIMSCHTRLAP